MRLYHFINERETFRYEIINEYPVSIDNAIAIIDKNCKKYLKETKGKWFQRSMEITSMKKGQIGFRNIRQNRRALGMEQRSANDLNKWLVKNGHADRSKSVMCSRKPSELFGEPFYIFISGDYKYTWVESKDMNMDDNTTGWYGIMIEEYLNLDTYEDESGIFYGPPHIRKERTKKQEELNNFGVPRFHKEWDEVDKEHNQKVKEWLKKEFPKMFHTNKGMNIAYNKNYEIWFQAKDYYFFDADDTELFLKLKKGLR